jgi:hypothetical protein
MECLVLVGIGAALLLGGWAYQSGKREGSRKGFGVGRDRARHGRR